MKHIQLLLDDGKDNPEVASGFFDHIPRMGEEICYVFCPTNDEQYNDEARLEKARASEKEWIVTRVYHECREYGNRSIDQRPHIVFLYVKPKRVAGRRNG